MDVNAEPTLATATPPAPQPPVNPIEQQVESSVASAPVDKPANDPPAQKSAPRQKNKNKNKKSPSEYEERVLELFAKYRPDYEKAYFSNSKENTCTHAEFQFEHLFDPLRDPKLPVPPLPRLKPYDPLAPIPDVSWSKEDVEKRAATVKKWKKKTQNFYYYNVHVVKPENDKKKPSKMGAALNGIARPSKARAAYQLFEVEQGEGLAKDIKRLWLERPLEVVEKEDEEFARLNAERVAKGEPAKTKRSGPSIAFCQQIVRERFAALSVEERKDFEQRAKAEAMDKRAEYAAAVKKPIEHTPEQRQQAIDNIGSLVSPLIEEIRRHTGLHIIVSAYGPLPSAQGQLGVLTWSAGRNRDPVPLSFMRKCPSAAAAYRARLLAYVSTAFSDKDIADACPAPDSGVICKTVTTEDFELDDDAAVRRGDRRWLKTRSREGNTGKASVKDLEDIAMDGATPPADNGEGSLPNTAAIGNNKSRKRRREKSISDEDTDDDEGDDSDMDVDGSNESGPDEDEPQVAKKPRFSSYETNREARIAANKALLESLGLDDAAKKLKMSMKEGGTKKTQKKTRTAVADNQRRRSSRLQGEGSPSVSGEGTQHGTSAQAQGGAPSVTTAPETSTPETTAPETTAPKTTSPETTVPVPTSSEPPAPIVQPRPTPRQATNKTSSCATVPTDPSSNASGRDEGDNAEVDQAVGNSCQPAFNLVDMNGLDMDKDAILEEAEDLRIEAPAYIADTLQRMEEKDVGMLGCPWKVFLARLLLLESEGEFNLPMKDLPAGNARDGTQRPPMLTAWVKSGRCRRNAENVPKDMPLLAPKDLASHIATFSGWWGMMQPSWRRCKEGKWARNGYDASLDLGGLNTRGTCGWLSVVACLWWWGICVHEGEDESAKRLWESALADADWMLTVVLVCGEREGKE
ncbi:hypothetical protein CYLTODRAFT_415127 [Cylindrobasidium torrendii FP15055 ss-10]|uniref:Uncharacterized protein n=1 Tax=Cylindrobasidium torrendii FP15055 ss-10 TaxID=1314674 RepID=A0A0D7AVK6_9AGAR|nr:hypothetical protein CYLTODRAFT_415127 [Cylindrobasidium torrendii FP15055 ss-10]